jgi:signal transduction histidine kinase
MSVHIPETDDGASAAVEIGQRRAAVKDIATVRRLGRASTTEVAGGSTLLQPVALDADLVAVVEVYVPEAEVSNGVGTAWAVLAAVGVALILGSVAVADRLGVRMVQPAQRLVEGAHELGEGKLGARVPEEGPKELRLAAEAFNSMADQVVQLLANERELAADLSHRLRTPLTVLRLNAASLGDTPVAEQTRAAVAKLEGEVDTIIRTAREAKPQTTAVGPGAGCDAAEVVRQRMEFWSALAEDEGRKWRLAGVDRPVRVPVARADLAASLDALLGNVFRHTPEGTAFTVTLHQGSGTVGMLIADAGPGISDPETALRRGASGSGSTGLGLDIARQLAESSGGAMRIDASSLGGARVQLWFRTDQRDPTPRATRRLVGNRWSRKKATR